MHSTLNPTQTDPDDILVVAPDIVLVAHADKSDPAHDATSRPWDPQIPAGSDVSAGPSVPPVDTTFRAAAINTVQNNVRVPGDRPSIGARAIRAFIGFLLALCIGVAGVAWQSYGDAAKQMIARWAPQLTLTSSPPLENPGLPEQPNPPAVQASAAKAAPPQPPALAQTASEGVAALSPAAAQLLQSVEQEIEQLKARIAQLKASQEQMSRDIAKVSEVKASEVKASEVRASEQNLRPRISAISPPPRRPAVAPAHRPMPAPYPPAQAAAVPPPLPQAVAPYVPQQPEPPPQARAQPQDEPVPRPPMPVR
jgi:hypothetical protein